jgi:hypothetical protein
VCFAQQSPRLRFAQAQSHRAHEPLHFLRGPCLHMHSPAMTPQRCGKIAAGRRAGYPSLDVERMRSCARECSCIPGPESILGYDKSAVLGRFPRNTHATGARRNGRGQLVRDKYAKQGVSPPRRELSRHVKNVGSRGSRIFIGRRCSREVRVNSFASPLCNSPPRDFPGRFSPSRLSPLAFSSGLLRYNDV